MKKFNKNLLAGTIGVIAAFLMSTSVFAAVSVKVTGDTDHLPKQHTAYETWLETSCEYTDGMTAKDAVLNTLTNNGFTYVYYDSDYLASITSDKGVTLPGQNSTFYSGWMYNVNGVAPSVGLAGYALTDNDEIEVYYVDDYRAIYGYGANITVSPEDAQVSIFDKDNNEVLDYGWGYSLLPGEYTYTVEKAGYKTENGSFTVTDDDAVIDVTLEKKENVAVVRIIGDSIHEEGAHADYQLWTESDAEVKEGDTAEAFITAALADMGAEPVKAEAYGSTYISGVKLSNGDVLGEFTNGSYSGWIYTVNGIAPYVGVGEYAVQAGDEIVFHYYDDYREFYGYTVYINTYPEAKVTVAHAGTGEVVEENSWGGYSLVPDNYSYTAEKDGYVTAAGNFEVTNEDITMDLVLEQLFVFGDFNLNGKIEADDAANILQKALVSTFPAQYEDITYIDVDENGKIEAADASYVMQKALVSTFVLPCEETVS